MNKPVNFMSVYFREFDGYGHSALEMVRALMNQDVDVRPRVRQSVDPTLPKEMRRLIERITDKGPIEADTVIYYCLPPMFYHYEDTYEVGFTQFEASRLPDFWVENIEMMTECWTTCDALVEVFKQSGVTIPLYTVPLGVRADRYKPVRRKKEKPFVFMHTGLPEHRKGYDLVIKAYRKAFLKHHDDIRLCLKGFGIPEELNRRQPMGIDFVLGRTPLNRLMELYKRAQAFVYPSRGEGWGMIPLEAICTGLPTIITPYLGMSEFAHLATHQLNYELVDADYYEHLLPCGEWAEPAIDDIADAMVDIYDNYEEYEEQAYENALKAASEFSWERSGEIIKKHLTRIWGDMV